MVYLNASLLVKMSKIENAENVTRFCARRIVETSPLAIQEIVRNNLIRAGALSDEGVDSASASSQESDAVAIESEGSFASSDNE